MAPVMLSKGSSSSSSVDGGSSNSSSQDAQEVPSLGGKPLARPTEDYGSDEPMAVPAAKKAKVSANARAMAEQAKSMKSMASFFGKKGE